MFFDNDISNSAGDGMYFNNLDFLILGLYCVGIIGLAQYVSRSKSGKEVTSEDYFLAGISFAGNIFEVFRYSFPRDGHTISM